jgi:hypothetical protein
MVLTKRNLKSATTVSVNFSPGFLKLPHNKEMRLTLLRRCDFSQIGHRSLRYIPTENVIKRQLWVW